MSDWDASDIEEPQIVIPKKKQWEDEDADDGIKDSWEESDEEKPVVEVKKKVPLAQKIAEREARLKEEKERKALESKSEKDLTAEELKQRREQQKRLQEEADLQNAADLFGDLNLEDAKAVESAASPSAIPVALMQEKTPKTKAEFDNFAKEISEYILKNKANRNYGGMIETLVRNICEPLKDVELRKISSALTASANDKQRAAKEALKGKKKGAKKSNVKVEADTVEMTRGPAYDDDDFDDFM
ncbi:translation initiation factor eIF3 subunit [Neoconidiobolus thromboides FSU 785]|nr:translation initiation factor eIF3 subunit [Neoconidiobolus thromboides FSU 785]